MARLPIDFGDDDPQALADYTARLPVAPPNPGMTHYYIPGSIADYEAEEAAKANPLVFAPAITQSFSTANKLLSGEVPFAGPQEIYNRLTGANGQERYQTWPEQMVRSGFALPADVYSGRLPVMMGEHTNPELISRTQDLSGMAGGGSVAGVGREATLASSGKMRAYHGTNKSIDKFEPSKSGEFGPGVYLTDRPDSAEAWAYRTGHSDEGLNIIPTDVELKNPFTVTKQEWIKMTERKTPREIHKKLQDEGYDGIIGIGLNGVDKQIIPFKPHEQIRNAITGQLMSDTSTNAPISALAKTPVFYSAVEKAVKEAKQNTATGEQWLGYLRNQPGVKQEELDWVLHELPKGQISKADLEQFVQEHKVELKELHLGENDKGAAFSNPIDWFRPVVMEIKNLNDVALAKKHNVNFRETFKDWPDSELFDKIQEYQKIPYTEFHDKPKYSQWQLPGGENYREQLLSLPNEIGDNIARRMTAIEKELGPHHDVSEPRRTELRNEYSNLAKQSRERNDYQSSHWDELNVLAHIRTNERTIPSVGNSLHIEEIQSDWHQAGRKQGYKGELNKLQPEFDKIEKKIMDSNDESILADPELPSALKKAVDKKLITSDEAKVYSRYSQISASGSTGGVPDAPFKASWADLALKRVIAEAARQGKDSISWTPGEAQAARYDLSKHIDRVTYDKHGTLAAYAKSNGERVIERKASEKELSDLIGKEAAEKLIKSKADEYGNRALENADLKIGGEGMKGFYDKILVDKANAIAKKFGGKVEQGGIEGGKQKYEVTNYRDGSVQILDNAHEANQLANSDPAGIGVRTINDKQPIHVLRITPELRDAALNKGFALFADTGKVGAPLAALTKVEHNPFKLGELEKQHGVKLTPVESNPFTATSFHGSPNPIRGERLEPMGRYEVTPTDNKYKIYDKVNKRFISEDLPTKEAANDWLDKRVGTEFYSTPNPRLAGDYATANKNGKGQNITPLRLDISKYHEVDALGRTWDAINTEAIRQAEMRGSKGVIVRNVHDDADPTLGARRGAQTVYITLDPSTVRGRFAKFDPAKFGESGLLKAGGLPIYSDENGNQLLPTPKGLIRLTPVSHDPFKKEK